MYYQTCALSCTDVSKIAFSKCPRATATWPSAAKPEESDSSQNSSGRMWVCREAAALIYLRFIHRSTHYAFGKDIKWGPATFQDANNILGDKALERCWSTAAVSGRRQLRLKDLHGHSNSSTVTAATPAPKLQCCAGRPRSAGGASRVSMTSMASATAGRCGHPTSGLSAS